MTRRQFFVALVVLFVGGVIGIGLSTWLVPGQSAWAQEEAATAKEIRDHPGALGTRVGRLGFLRDVHGLDCGETTVAPVAPIVRLLGGTMSYDPPNLSVRSSEGATEIEMKLGSALATIGGNDTYMSFPMLVFSGMPCASVRFVAEALGAQVGYDANSLFGSGPAVSLTIDGAKYWILVHGQPPDAVAEFVSDMEYTTQTDVLDGWESAWGAYGVDWVLRVTELELDTPYFASSCPCIWDETPPFYCGWYDPEQPDADPPPCFWSNAAGIYTKRSGKWEFLLGTQDTLSYADCERAGLPIYIAEALGLDPEWRPPQQEPVLAEPTTQSPRAPVTASPPASPREPVDIGGGYSVEGLNFQRLHDFRDRGVEALGQLTSPRSNSTRATVVVLTVTAYDEGGQVLGFGDTTIFVDLSGGTPSPFRVRLPDVRLDALDHVSIVARSLYRDGR